MIRNFVHFLYIIQINFESPLKKKIMIFRDKTLNYHYLMIFGLYLSISLKEINI